MNSDSLTFCFTELYPDNDNPFELVMIVLTTGLMLAIIFTGVIVVLNRENIIIKSARYELVTLVCFTTKTNSK